jgi:hypothetical protein
MHENAEYQLCGSKFRDAQPVDDTLRGLPENALRLEAFEKL